MLDSRAPRRLLFLLPVPALPIPAGAAQVGRLLRRILPRFTILTLVLVAAVTAAVAVEWYQHYEKGLDALQEQRWEEAVRELTDAIRRRAEPGASVHTSGSRYVTYLPYLKLGIAYFNMGQYEKALNAFETEENFGEIDASGSDMKNLRTFRDLARAELERPAEEAGATPLYSYVETITTKDADGNEREIQARYFITADELVEKSLKRARAREGEGRLEEAMNALGPGLAVDPENAELNAFLQRLRNLVVEQEEERALQEQLTRVVGEGQAMLELGRYEEASMAFQQVLALDAGHAEAQALLRQSQARLREKLEAERTEEAGRKFVERGLENVINLRGAGLYSEALKELQSILALEPRNTRALELQEEIAQVRADQEAAAVRRREVVRLLEAAVGQVQAQQYQEAVGTLNRLIALDPHNASAKSYLASAFTAMNEEFLADSTRPPAPKLPPVIALANVATVAGPPGEAGGQELPEESVSDPAFVLSGIILDDQPDMKLTIVMDGAAEEMISASGVPVGNLFRHQFTRPIRLNAGLTSVRVIASDLDGLQAETIHRVRYVPPMWRSPWPYGAAGAALLASLVTLQGVRIRRRNLLLRRRFNPYVAGAPVLSDSLFMGREALLSRVLQTVHNNSILLFGERRIGKTSLQHHLKKRLRQVLDSEYEFHPVYIDLQGTPQERFFATLASDIFHELKPLLDGLEPDPRITSESGYAYETFVRDIRNVIKALKQRSGKTTKLVLLIDEVDELNDYDPKVNQKLRSLFMKSFAEDMVAVVSGVGIKKKWDSEGSPWYNFFEEIEIQAFSREDAAALIERPIKGVFQLDEGVTDRIIEKTECKPYLIQKLCIELVNRLHEERRKRVTVADVEAVGQPREA